MSFSDLPPGYSLSKVQPFHLSLPQQSLDELKELLKLSRLAVPTFENTHNDFSFGVQRDWLQGMKEKWLDLDWRKTEERINSFPNFEAQVQDETGEDSNIHFIALFSKRPNALPLLLLHGWPGSFLEFLPILQILKDKYRPHTLPYHVVVPSLPGFTLSSGPPLGRNSGFDDTARVLDRLVVQGLGFSGGYMAQGGDIGAHLAQCLGSDRYPKCKAIHLNFVLLPTPPSGAPDIDSLPSADKEGVNLGQAWLKTGTAYAYEHATRPATIGLVLASSPLALLAWVGEKYLTWVDAALPDETILELVSLYWLTSSSERCIYQYRDEAALSSNPFIQKPVGFSSFPKEVFVTPRSWAEAKMNIKWYRKHDQGGHFAALERPVNLLQDVEEFADSIRIHF